MNETILIVDDTPTNLQVLVGFLGGAGYQTLIAEDGPTALAQLAREAPQMVLLDVAMPEMDGFETCRRIKQLAGFKDVPVLFLTARTEMEDKLRGFRAGAVDYISKPIQKEEVLARVNTHLTILSQKRQLEGVLEQRERFMRIAAHDLRNLLTVVSGFSQVGRSAHEPETKQLALERIEKAGQSMQAIIDGFLCLQTLHKNGAGQQAPFQLRPLLEQVVEQSAFSAHAKGITLGLELPAGPLWALGHLAHTHQILTNYITNAIKYSPWNSRSQIRLSRREGFWRVEVADQGPGIALAERAKLFIEFAKISNKPTGGERSTGLGLAIVKGLAEAQGGSVGADFPAEGGSRFWFEVPATSAPAPEPAASP